MLGKSLWLHGGLLAFASLVASRAWLSDGAKAGEQEVEVWPGQASQITQIEYSAPDTKAVFSQQKDELGGYWVVTLDSEKADGPRDPHKMPRPVPEEGSPEKDDSPKKWEQEKFIGVEAAAEFADQLAPLRAVRSLGKLPEERAEEFGFDEEAPKKSLKVQFAGVSKELSIGGNPPGGGHLYARDEQSGQVYVLGGSIAGTLGAVKSRLMQRAFHLFGAEEARQATISAGGASRKLVRSEGQGSFWADAAEKDKKDESTSNWMKKFERLNAKKYVEELPKEPTPIARVAFADPSGQSLGFVELAKIAAEDPSGDAEYYARSETTRWWVSVSAQSAAQLEADIATVVSD